jgi:saccharopine dehydrogenase (NAD+, L-lysine-forming)
LIDAGFLITVERSATRCFPDADYAVAGARLAASGSWPKAPAQAIIVGLKELPADGLALAHRHVFFCHAFKEQKGWREELARFTRGGGALYDMEYLTFPDGRRVAAFGRPAGLAGAAAAVLAWCAQQDGKPLGPLEPFKTQLHMVAHVKHALGNRKPRTLVLGALGRSGRGAADVLDSVGCEVTLWDLPETTKGGPFPELLEYDIVVNCILLLGAIPPFLTAEMVARKARLSVICDVSCDTSNPHNPLPFINQNTTLTEPVLQVNCHLQAIAIDHLPTLLPVESSEAFSADLLPHYLTIPDGEVWERALKLFKEKSAQK